RRRDRGERRTPAQPDGNAEGRRARRRQGRGGRHDDLRAWRSQARLTCTDQLAQLLAAALRLQSPHRERADENWRSEMLETIAIILIVLWLLGVVSGYTLGNFIYVLLVIAIVLFLVRLVSGRRVV